MSRPCTPFPTGRVVAAVAIALATAACDGPLAPVHRPASAGSAYDGELSAAIGDTLDLAHVVVTLAADETADCRASDPEVAASLTQSGHMLALRSGDVAVWCTVRRTDAAPGADAPQRESYVVRVRVRADE